jgi:hypothetical protein
MTKIVIDCGDDVFTDKTIKNFGPYNALFIPGGGTSQTLFAMGAIQRMLDDIKIVSNGEFKKSGDIFKLYRLISSTSGGTIVVSLMEICLLKGYHKKKNWFQKYVVKNLYRLAQSRLGAKFLLSGIKVSSAVETLINIIRPKRLLDFKHIDKTHGVVFLYNYINATKETISADHSDLIDEHYNIKTKGITYLEVFLERIARCCLPIHISEFNQCMSLDAGYASNTTINPVFNVYGKPRNTTIILRTQRLISDDYKKPTYINLIRYLNSIVQNVSNTVCTDTIDRLIDTNGINMNISMCNNLNKSEFKHHKDVWFWWNEVPTLNSFFLGLLFYDEDASHLIEREGNFQAFTAINKTFKLSNRELETIMYPETYGPEAKTIFEKYKKTAVIKAFIGDLITEYFAKKV